MCGSSSGVAEGQGVSVGGGVVITNHFVWQFFWGCRRTGGLCRGGGVLLTSSCGSSSGVAEGQGVSVGGGGLLLTSLWGSYSRVA